MPLLQSSSLPVVPGNLSTRIVASFCVARITATPRMRLNDLRLQADHCMHRVASGLLCSSGMANGAVTLQPRAFSLPRQWTGSEQNADQDHQDVELRSARSSVDPQDLVLARQMWSQHGMVQKRSCATTDSPTVPLLPTTRLHASAITPNVEMC
ncbi:hypothetical protein D0868_02282 [Hortaea werneckii]|uniref:Uncharacterized protein n=1 Tax=Hortaea werneckii TaxID=91943 RepID=A0A3M6ZCC9_HORWE|nr:hypothetical protein D0868_02282 [Hortaea werneckii]